MISLPARLDIKEEIPKRMLDIFDFNMRCASPGIIVSFDAVKQTATVQIAISEQIRCNDPDFIARHGSNVGPETIPTLVDVPIVIPRAGGFAVTLPINAGDECLVVFSDTCFDAWYQNGCSVTPNDPDHPYGSQPQMSLRRHDLSDGFAIIGVCSQPKTLTGYSVDSLQVRDEEGNIYLDAKDGKVSLSGLWDSLRSFIDERFISLFNNHTHLYAPGPGSLVPTAVPAVPLVEGDCNTQNVRGL